MYDPENPPPEGIPADPLPGSKIEGDPSDTTQHDDHLPSDAGMTATLRYRRRNRKRRFRRE